MDKDPRPSMKGAPCGRRIFKKCVGEEWDGKKGCPYWQSMFVTVQEGKSKYEVVRSQCIDLWAYDVGWFNQNRLSGIQGATESFRNGMLEPYGEEGGRLSFRPKPDAAIEKILAMTVVQKRLTQ
uniref:Uncharacterized protein n=1 Tax=viral metagenome TaxID=1070528 RepID=A0A6M3IQQ8_9ZZZZ